MNRAVFELIDYIRTHDGIADKATLSKLAQQEFALIKDRSVYYSSHYAIRFSSTRSNSFSNTVVALSTLQNMTSCLSSSVKLLLLKIFSI